MIILRQKEFGFKEKLENLASGAVVGAVTSLIFGMPIISKSKVTGKSYQKAIGYTMLAGAILGGLIGYKTFPSENLEKEWQNWINNPENRKKLEDIVKRNLPSSLPKLNRFKEELEKYKEIKGYLEFSIPTTTDELITALGAQIFIKYRKDNIFPDDFPIPMMSITNWDFEETWILWYSKDKGWIHEGKSISGPKDFVLDRVKYSYSEYEEEKSKLLEKVVELANKYL